MFGYLFQKSSPRYSHDGTTLLYTVYDTDSGSGLGWSPDGVKVLLRRTFSGSPSQLLQINPDGTGGTLLSFSAAGGTW